MRKVIKAHKILVQQNEHTPGLCLLCAYRDKEIDYDMVVNTISTENARKMVLKNIMDENNIVK